MAYCSYILVQNGALQERLFPGNKMDTPDGLCVVAMAQWLKTMRV